MTARASRFRIAATVGALAFAVAPVALAGKNGNGNKAASAVAPLSLVSESVWNSPNPAAPTWCLNEDDYHKRTWSGSLDGTFTTTEQLCGTSADYSGGIWWDGGGVGFVADVYVVGSLADATITSPDGASHHAVLMDSSTSRGVTTDHYSVCYVPPYSFVSNTGGTSLRGGTWQFALTGPLKKATYSVTAEMSDVPFQQQRCPASQQNLVP